MNFIKFQKEMNAISNEKSFWIKMTEFKSVYSKFDEQITTACNIYSAMNHEDEFFCDDLVWKIDEENLIIHFKLPCSEYEKIHIPLIIFDELQEEKISRVVYWYMEMETERLKKIKKTSIKYKSLIKIMNTTEKSIQKDTEEIEKIKNDDKYTDEYKRDKISVLEDIIESDEKRIYSEDFQSEMQEYKDELHEARKRKNFVQYYYEKNP